LKRPNATAVIQGGKRIFCFFKRIAEAAIHMGDAEPAGREGNREDRELRRDERSEPDVSNKQ